MHKDVFNWKELTLSVTFVTSDRICIDFTAEWCISACINSRAPRFMFLASNSNTNKRLQTLPQASCGDNNAADRCSMTQKFSKTVRYLYSAIVPETNQTNTSNFKIDIVPCNLCIWLISFYPFTKQSGIQCLRWQTTQVIPGPDEAARGLFLPG